MNRTMEKRAEELRVLLAKRIEEGYKALAGVNVQGIWEYDGELPVLVVEIDGDWKHDHLRAKFILEELGWCKFGETVTDDTGCDWYTAEHRYIVPR